MPEPDTLTVIIPAKDEAETIGHVLKELPRDLIDEIIVVDGHSTDDTVDVVRRAGVRVITQEGKGYGNGVRTGLKHATGRYVTFLDADGSYDPAALKVLLDRIREGYDVVFSRYDVKHHHPLRNLGSRFNNAVASVLLGKDRSLYLSSFKAIDRFLIDEILKYSGPYPYIDGLVLRATSRYGTQLVEHQPRRDGESNYTATKLVHLWLNMFTNFSVLPLRLASLLGLAVAILGGVGALVFVIEYIRNPDLPAGWASLAVLLMVLAGVQLFALGMIGEYLGRLFLMHNETPMYVARETVNCEPPSEEPCSPPSIQTTPRR